MFSKTVLPIATAHTGGKGRSAGFTLLEVVIAAAITGLALVGLFQAGTSGVFAVDGAARVDEAIERAQSHLAAFGRSGAVTPGEIEGDDGGGYHWRLRSRPIATQQAAAPDQIASAMTLFAVDVEISWRAWGRNRSVVLDTRRLGSGASME